MIRITKKSIYFEFVEIVDGQETVQLLDVFTTNLGIVSYLTFQTIIEKDVTVEDLFKHIAKTPEAIDFAFDASLGGHQLKFFLEELAQPSKPDKNLIEVEIAHEMDPVFENGELFDIRRFRGVGKNEEVLSIELSPIATYKHLPLRLNTAYVILDKDGETVFEGYKMFTLYEVIHAMLYEISYHGDPKARKEVYDEMIEKYAGDETATSVTDNNSIEKLNKDLQKMIDEENYENAAKIRDKIKQLSSNKDSHEKPKPKPKKKK